VAHQFGLNQLADTRWLTLTRAIKKSARWLDAVLQAYPSPEAILGCAREPAKALALEGLKRALDKPAPIDFPSGLIGDSPLCLITPRDPEYPPLLRECPDRPPFLFCRGVLPYLGAATLSIVGTRKPSLEGRRAAREFAAAAAASGLVVVSGLALGIDGIAHDAALTAGGSTVAVLPSGMDRIYPARHQRLAERVMAEGVLVSEFPLGTPPRKHHFHRRNRTLSGFSEATLVVEAGRPSGTLITASAAADQGRDVLVLPWSIYHREGAGCRYLLEDGAVLVQSVEAMRAHLGVPTAPSASLPQSHPPASAGSCSVSTLDADQQAMLALLGSGTHGADTLSAYLNWDINRCLACLTALEVLGRIRRVSGGYTAIA
jgi:DNA processing protein